MTERVVSIVRDQGEQRITVAHPIKTKPTLVIPDELSEINNKPTAISEVPAATDVGTRTPNLAERVRSHRREPVFALPVTEVILIAITKHRKKDRGSQVLVSVSGSVSVT